MTVKEMRLAVATRRVFFIKEPKLGEATMSGNQQTIYVFQCTNNPQRYGATADKAGSNLPPQGCPGGTWKPHSQIALGPTPQPRVALDETELRHGLQSNGFYLWEVNINVTITDSSGKLLQ